MPFPLNLPGPGPEHRRRITDAEVVTGGGTFSVTHTWDAVIIPDPNITLRPTQGKPQGQRIVPRSKIVSPPAVTAATSTVSHTWDAVISLDVSLTSPLRAPVPFPKVIPRSRIVSVVTTLATSTVTHTWDAVVQKTLSVTHTWDAVIVLASSAVIKGRKPYESPTRLLTSRLVTVPFPVVTTATLTHTWDAVVQKTATVTHTWDAVIVLASSAVIKGRKPFESPTSLRGSRLVTVPTPVLAAGTLTHTWDAVVFKTLSVTHTWDAVIVLASSAVIKGRKPFESPTRLLTSRLVTVPFPIVTTLTQTHTWDALVQNTTTVIHTWDAVIVLASSAVIKGRKPFESPTRLLTSRLITVPFPVVGAATVTHTWDAVVFKTLSVTHTWDAVIVLASSAVIKGRKPFESPTRLLTSRVVTVPFPIQAAGTLTHTWDAVVQKTLSVTHTWDAVIVLASSAVIRGRSPYESRTSLRGSRLSNTPLPLVFTKTHTWDAVVQKTATQTHTWDAVVKKTLTRTHTWDALVQKSFTRTHTWDAVVAKTLTRTHTWDGVVKKTLTRTHTWDAVTAPPSFGTFTRTHTWDAFIYAPYPQWPTDDGTQWPTDDGSNWAGGSGGPQWPTATSSGDKIRNGTADNAGQVGFDTFYGSWVGGTDPGAVTAIVTDGGGPVFSLSQTVATTNANPIACAGHRDTGYVSTPPGRYHWSFRIKAIRSNNMEYYIVWWDAVLTTIELSMSGNEVLTPAQGWVQRDFYFDLPATAVHAQLNWRTNGLLTTGECFRVDDIVLRQESQWRTTTSGGW